MASVITVRALVITIRFSCKILARNFIDGWVGRSALHNRCQVHGVRTNGEVHGVRVQLG